MKKYLVLLIVSLLTADSTEKILTLNEPLDDITSMKVNIDFGMGELLLEQGQEEFAVTGYLKYNTRFTDAIFEYQTYSTKGFLDVGTDMDLNWSGENKKDDQKGNESEIYLTSVVPVKLSIDFGMGSAQINLENLQVSDMTLDCSMGEVIVDFGESINQTSCKHIDIDTGLGSAEVLNILNSNSTLMEFECGLGAMELDFSGELNEDIEVDLSVGLGTIEIQIPKGINVIFEYDGSFLSSVDLEDFNQVDDEEYHSEEFIEGEPIIKFTASIGAGSIDIRWID